MTLTTVISASNMNGLGVSSDRVAPGDTFTVTVSVPPCANADTAYIKVEFDASAFEVMSWEPAMSGGIYNSGEGFFVLTAANASRDIALGAGYEARAQLAVKRSASFGTYAFRLTQHSISYINDDGIDYVELWQPAVTEVAVSVGDRSAGDTTTTTTAPAVSSPNPATSHIDPSQYNDNDQDGSRTQMTYSTAPAVTTQFIYTSYINDNAPGVSYTQPIVDIPAEAITPTDGYDAETTEAPTYAAPTDEVILSGDGEIELIAVPENSDEPDTYLTAETAEPSYSPENTGTAEIELHSKLKGVTSAKTIVSTHKGNFTGSVEIVLSNTKSSETYAKTALKSLGMSGSTCYAFDISLYDMASGGQIHSLPGGYIDFWVPIPQSLAGGGYDLRVYRVEVGNPTLVSANAAADDGKHVYFRASDFSPYMIVGIANDTESLIVPSNTVSAASGGARNPHTGTAAAILLPAAFGSCFVLVRKNGRRKRSSRRK